MANSSRYCVSGKYGDIWSRIDKNGAGGCWLWLGATNRDGYGPTKPKGDKLRVAHRVIYEMLVGPIPDGLQLDHLCRVRPCVNPEHLEPVTCRENLLRTEGDGPGTKARQTHCKHGHPFDTENTGSDPRGGRFCKACRRIRGNAANKRRRAVA